MGYNTKPIIEIRPSEEYFLITWRVDLRCNFDCMYCPNDFHDTISPTKTLDQLKQAWIKIFESSANKNLKYKIGFTGGEITINKNFLPFVKWLRQNYGDSIDQLGISTNGSASEKYYKEIFQYLDYISFSIHSEFFNEKKFFNNVIECNNQSKSTNKIIHVNIMDEPWHHERIKTYIDFFIKNQINYTLAQIDFKLKIRNIHQVNSNKQLYEF